MSAKKSLPYSSTGVDYSSIDPFKVLAQDRARKTAINLENWGFREVAQSRGEPCYVWEEPDCFRAETIEGLGTKSLVADEMYKLTGKSFYRAVAKDTVAMIVNDVITSGANPLVVSAYFAAGESSWFKGPHAKELTEGWFEAVQSIGATWGGGESPALKGIINDGTIDLAGSVHGIIKPKKNLVTGEKLEDGDQIVFVESSGIHANGLTLARALVERLSHGYLTKLSGGQSFGEALLAPTHLYPGLVSLVQKSIDIHYMANITGHGFRKIMRADRDDLSYIIETLPEAHEVFRFIQEHSGNSDDEMYGNVNMGAGFAFYVDKKDVKKVIDLANADGLNAMHAGYVRNGDRKVEIKPLNLTFGGSTLEVR